MRKLSALVLFLAVLSPVSAQFTLDFDTPDQFSSYFSSEQEGPITQSATGGLNNSGAMDLSGLGGVAQQIVTFNHGFSSQLSSWSTSVYYYGNIQNLWQFGVTTAAAPTLVEGWAFANGSYLPAIWLEAGNNEGGAFAVGSYDGTDTPSYDTQFVSDGLSTDAAWYHLALDVSYTGGSHYDITGTLTAANADGSLGDLLSTSFLSIDNEGIDSADTLYLYLNLFDGVAIDNFTTTTYSPTAIPEPSTYAAIFGAVALGAVVIVRRRQSKQG